MPNIKLWRDTIKNSIKTGQRPTQVVPAFKTSDHLSFITSFANFMNSSNSP